MTFLAPAAGIIAAAITLPTLLLLYFLRLRRRPLRVSSILLWEQAAQDLQVNVPFRMLRWSWLLLLHFIALACFLIAIARPAIGEGGISSARIVILIDHSASMNATDMPPATPGGPPTTRLSAAKALASDLIDRIGRGGAGSQRPHCMVVSLAAAPVPLTAFTPDLRAMRDAVNSISPTDQPDDLGAALRIIDAMTLAPASESESAPAKPAVYFITDGVIALPSPGLRRGLDPIVLPVAPPLPTAAERPRPDNVGIVAISARHDPDDSELIRVFARLLNSGPQTLELTVRCDIDGRLPTDGVRAISIPAAIQSPEGEVVPGEAAAVFAVRPAPSAAPRSILVSITRPDILAADNAAGVILAPPRRPRILLVVPSPVPPATEPEADVFLLQALEATEPASLRIVPASIAASAPVASGAVRTPSPWTNADLIVFDRVTPPEDALPSQATLSFGSSLQFAGLSISADPGRNFTRALVWKRDHPALRYVGLDSLLIAPSTGFTLPDSASPADALAIESLVEGESGPLVVEITSRAVGFRFVRRILVAFDLARSNWGPDISFPMFIGNTVEYLASAESSSGGIATPLSTTDALNIDVSGQTQSIISTGADEATFELPTSDGSDRTVRIGPLPRVGVHSFISDDGRSLSPSIAIVNLINEAETSLITRSEALRAAEPSPAAGVTNDRDPREIWHWFILASLVPLTIEWFVYAWRMRG